MALKLTLIPEMERLVIQESKTANISLNRAYHDIQYMLLKRLREDYKRSNHGK